MKDILPISIVAFMTGIAVALFMTVGSLNRIYEKQLDADALLVAYNKGKADAVSLRPASWDLEMTCAALWMSQQPVRSAH